MSTRFGVVFYDEKTIVPKNLRSTVIMLVHRGGHPSNKKTNILQSFYTLLEMPLIITHLIQVSEFVSDSFYKFQRQVPIETFHLLPC